MQYGTKFDCLHLLKVQVSIRQNPAARGPASQGPCLVSPLVRWCNCDGEHGHLRQLQ